jgi:hypothetical protein
MSLIDRLRTRILRVVDGFVKPVPCEDQACESCRVTHCSPEQAARCIDRRCGEVQERLRRQSSVDVEVEMGVGDIPISARWQATHVVNVSGIEHRKPNYPEVSHVRASIAPESDTSQDETAPTTRRSREG